MGFGVAKPHIVRAPHSAGRAKPEKGGATRLALLLLDAGEVPSQGVPGVTSRGSPFSEVDMRTTSIASLGVIVVFAGACFAQQPASTGMVRSGPTARPDPSKDARETDPAIRQLMQFGNADALKQRLKNSNNRGKTVSQLLAEDKADATALATSLNLSCTVVNGSLVAEDAAAHTKTYEVACQSGPGYFLVKSDSPGPAVGFTCFAADAARQADIAAHREPGAGCALQENGTPKTMAASILSRAGKPCAVKDVNWRGQNATTDFVEASCEGVVGFVLRLPLPGSQSPVRIDTCNESAIKGLSCRLPGNDTTLVDLNAALAARKVACDAEAARVIGREVQKRRQVVEYFCPKQRPKGLVAFLPVEGSVEPFEVLDCASATKRQVICTLTKMN